MAEQTPAPIGLKVKLPFSTREDFVAQYGANVTRGGIYLRSKTVKAPGTPVTLELQLQDGSRLIYASAVVHFVTGQAGEGVSGMGLRFVTLDPETKLFLDAQIAPLPHAQASTPPVPPGVGAVDYGPHAAPAAQGAAGVQVASPAQILQPLQVPQPAPQAAAPAKPAQPAPPRARAAAAAPQTNSRVVVGAAPISAPAFEEPKEEPKRAGPIIGIDLGTTNSCASWVQKEKPRVLSSREGYNTVPSVIALNTRGKLVVGHPAKGQMLTNPRMTVYGAKRLVGRAYDSPIVQEIRDRFHYEVAAGPNGEAAVKLGDRVYSLQQISALILREVRELAQNQIGENVSRAVITVPAYYNDNQRQAVREAGRLAGLYVERILNEPTAAALAYGYGKDLKQRVLVYDLGGGTFDASVLELTGNVYEVVSTGGDTFLGGIDFDNAIVAYVLDEFQKKNGRPLQGDRVAMQRITDAAERAKCALSERMETRIHVPFVAVIEDKPYDVDVTLTRLKLVELTEKLVDRTLEVCDQVLKAKNLTPKDLDEIILVGGQSRFPLVHQKIQQYFGKPASKGVHPDEAVAVGASLLAHSLGQVEGVVLIDVLPMAIGIGLPGGRFKPVLDRNVALPATKRYTIGTAKDNQPELDVTVFQGESQRAQDNEYLGTLKMTGLPKGPRGSVRVEISFEVSNEALLTVKAKELSTGREVESVFSTRDTRESVTAKLEQLEGAPPGSAPAARHPPAPKAPPPRLTPVADAGPKPAAPAANQAPEPQAPPPALAPVADAGPKPAAPAAAQASEPQPPPPASSAADEIIAEVEIGTEQPEIGTAKPEIGTAKPEIRTPEIRTVKPDIGTVKPDGLSGWVKRLFGRP